MENTQSKRRYVLVEWPESQMLMHKEWISECYAFGEIGKSVYMVPEDRYIEIAAWNDVEKPLVSCFGFKPVR